jgi:hypothetical protein
VRKSTNRKVIGRGTVVQFIRSASQGLLAAIDKLEKGELPGAEEIRAAQKSVQRALEYFDIYAINRKRLRNELEKERERLAVLLQQFIELPITQDEKILSKRFKSKVPTYFTGTLTDPNSGTPLAGVKVSYFGHTVKTDKRGRYKIPGPEPGKYTLNMTWGTDPQTMEKVVFLTTEPIKSTGTSPADINTAGPPAPEPSKETVKTSIPQKVAKKASKEVKRNVKLEKGKRAPAAKGKTKQKPKKPTNSTAPGRPVRTVAKRAEEKGSR